MDKIKPINSEVLKGSPFIEDGNLPPKLEQLSVEQIKILNEYKKSLEVFSLRADFDIEQSLRHARENTWERILKAKEILRKETLSPKLMRIIINNNLRALFLDSTEEDELTKDEKFKLLDEAILGGRKCSRPKKEIEYEGRYPGIVGFDPSLRKTHPEVYFHQGKYADTHDIPLVSEGFSFCHAVIVFDKETCSSVGFHVVDYYMDQVQLKHLEDNFKVNGQREAIIIHGSESRESLDKPYLEEWGIKIIKTINVTTGPSHWSCKYDPKTNEIMVLQKALNRVLVYDGFSEDAYDGERFRKHEREKRDNLEMRETIIWIASNNHCKLEGSFTMEEFSSCVKEASSVLDKELNTDEVLRELIDNKEVLIKNNIVLIPRAFTYQNDNKTFEKLYHEFFDEKNYRYREKIRIFELYKNKEIYIKLMCVLEKYYVQGSRGILELKNNDEEIIIHVNSDEIVIASKEENQLLDIVRETLKALVNNSELDYQYSIGSSEIGDRIPDSEAMRTAYKNLREIGLI